MFCYRVGGAIFFANADKFVDQLYSDVLRPSDVQKSLTLCLVDVVVSDYRQESDDDSGNVTSTDDVEMSRLHSPNETAGCECNAYGDVQATTTEVADQNDNMKGDGVPWQDLDSGRVRVIVLDCHRVMFVDSTAAAALKKVTAAYRKVGVQLVLSGCDAKMLTMMTAAGLLDGSEGKIEIYPTVHDAVLAVG